MLYDVNVKKMLSNAKAKQFEYKAMLMLSFPNAKIPQNYVDAYSRMTEGRTVRPVPKAATDFVRQLKIIPC